MYQSHKKAVDDQGGGAFACLLACSTLLREACAYVSPSERKTIGAAKALQGWREKKEKMDRKGLLKRRLFVAAKKK